MPRPNRTRSVQAERNVAANVARLRGEQDPPWSIERLAARMEVAGCAIHPSALYKLEKADPPRRITVDELVAFSVVFSVPIMDLIRDPDERLPGLFVELQERHLLQSALVRRLDALLAEARRDLDQVIDEWNDLAKAMPAADRPMKAPRPVGLEVDPLPGAPEGVNEEAARQMRRAEYENEIDKRLRVAIHQIKLRRRSAKGVQR